MKAPPSRLSVFLPLCSVSLSAIRLFLCFPWNSYLLQHITEAVDNPLIELVSHDAKENQSSQRRRVHHDQDVEFDNFHITEDLILNILLCVPAISVLRFKCVCKKWYSLISNPDFLRSHSSLQFEKRYDFPIHCYDIRACLITKHFEVLFLPQDKLHLPLLKVIHPHPLSLFPENHRCCQLEDSCNGLLLLRFSEEDYLNVGKRTYYIFNLITKHYFKLPSTTPMHNFIKNKFRSTTHIVFDPSVSHSYKVIRWWFRPSSQSPDNIHCQLYSSETGSWRLLSTSFLMNPLRAAFCFESRPTLLNGVLYWSYGTTPLDVSYCFNVEKETVSFLPLPPKPVGCHYRDCLYFGECSGRLRLIEKYLVANFGYNEHLPLTLPCSFDIMEMDKEQQQQESQDGCNPWILKYHVNMEMELNCPVLRKTTKEKKKNQRVEFIHCYKTKNQGGEEEVLFLSTNQTDISSYNLTNNTFSVSNRIPITSYDFRAFFPFTPTLFPIS